jgi:hypothetical protein
LFITVVLHLPAQAVVLSGEQQVPLVMQMSPGEPHIVPPPEPQATLCPQLFVAEPQFFPIHVVVAGSGTQPHALDVHVRPPSQLPQSTALLQLS